MSDPIPAQMRLDNAANIYPASMSRRYTSLYRISLSLKEPVEPEVLQQALERVSERIPTFRCGLKAGWFWWYLHRLPHPPRVLPLKPLGRFRLIDQSGFLYRVSAVENHVILDVFHALADGFGAFSFLLTLVAEYLRLQYGITVPYDHLILDPSAPPQMKEVEDSFKTVFSGRTGRLEQNVKAYHLRGEAMAFGTVKDLRLVLPKEKVQAACARFGCTVTDLIVSAMVSALQEEHKADPNPRRRSVLKVSVPVNLRPLYGSRTVRNFSSYVNLGIDVKDGYLPFEQIVKRVHAQKEWELQPRNLEPKIARNVELEESRLVKMLPLFIKHPTIDIINRLHGDVFCSQTLSNLGPVKLPQVMTAYVQDIDFSLGRQRGNSGACSCLGYQDKLYLHFTRKIARDSFEQAFLKVMDSLDISYTQTLTGLA